METESGAFTDHGRGASIGFSIGRRICARIHSTLCFRAGTVYTRQQHPHSHCADIAVHPGALPNGDRTFTDCIEHAQHYSDRHSHTDRDTLPNTRALLHRHGDAAHAGARFGADHCCINACAHEYVCSTHENACSANQYFGSSNESAPTTDQSTTATDESTTTANQPTTTANQPATSNETTQADQNPKTSQTSTAQQDAKEVHAGFGMCQSFRLFLLRV
jgi:hypothetical protein